MKPLELSGENAKLKKMFEELSLTHEAFKEAVENKDCDGAGALKSRGFRCCKMIP